MLIEALVAIVVMTILGLGLVMSYGRGMVAQKSQRAQNLAASQMRALLQSPGTLCTAPPATLTLGSGVTVPLTVNCSTRQVTVTTTGGGSAIVTVPVVTLSVQNAALFGPGTLSIATVAP